MQIAHLIASSHCDPEDAPRAVERVTIPEAQAVSEADANRWSRELADRFLRALLPEPSSKGKRRVRT
jgi:hypothetical protein